MSLANPEAHTADVLTAGTWLAGGFRSPVSQLVPVAPFVRADAYRFELWLYWQLFFQERTTRIMSRDSMYNYSQFAWTDAISLAGWLDTEFDLEEVRRDFDAMSQMARAKFDHDNAELIKELLHRTEGQRPAFLRKVGKNASEATKGLLLVFCIMGLLRVRHLIEIRDRLVLMGPGGGYRVTNARIYEVRQQVQGPMLSLFTYEWPVRVFAEYSGDFSDQDDDGDE